MPHRLSIVLFICVAIPASAEDRNDGRRLLILHNGRVISGRITVVSSGFQVENNGQRVVVPRELVDLEAENLFEAYQKLRAGMTNPTSAGHLALARWCLGNGLRTQAMHELRAALKLAPNDTRAQGLLGELQPERRPKKTRAAAVMTTKPVASSGEALGGLPRDQALRFVRRVQPLLLNRCGMGGCHGSQGNSRFRLVQARIGAGGHRPATQRNLAAVLGWIDFERVAASPLLTVPRIGHGRGRRPVFSGSSARQQVALLEDWVRDVARSRRGGKTDFPAASTVPMATPLVPRRVMPREPVHPVPQGTRDRHEKTVESRLRLAPRPNPLVSTSRIVDVFDPEVFNRETRRRQAAVRAAASSQRGNQRRARAPSRVVPRR